MDNFQYYELATERAIRAGESGSDLSPDGKSILLLKAWLSPSQLAQFEDNGIFHVIGSHTGRQYCISRWRSSHNVTEITSSGTPIKSFCFLCANDSGYLYPEGDVLLAQKIALEINEEETLRIASHSYMRFPIWLFRLFRKFL